MEVIDYSLRVRQVTPERTFLSQAGAHDRVVASIMSVADGLLEPWHDKLVVVAVGTDRSTGDALGPLVGSALLDLLASGEAEILGNLKAPVHANNLAEALTDLRKRWNQPFVIAVDACLGSAENVGSVTVSPGPLQPGAGVNKQLPEVGNMHVTGTVNVGGFMEYFVLQNTRLGLVMSMAELIAGALSEAVTMLGAAR